MNNSANNFTMSQKFNKIKNYFKSSPKIDSNKTQDPFRRTPMPFEKKGLTPTIQKTMSIL